MISLLRPKNCLHGYFWWEVGQLFLAIFVEAVIKSCIEVEIDLVSSKTFGALKILKFNNYNIDLQKPLLKFTKILPNFL